MRKLRRAPMAESLLRVPRSPDFCYGESLLQEIILMSIPQQPNIRLVNAADYRDTYANSIQIRVSVWDFLLVFGRLQPVTAQEVEVQNFQGIYLSPQQAKALLTILAPSVKSNLIPISRRSKARSTSAASCENLSH
jgi:hypothetical protein